MVFNKVLSTLMALLLMLPSFNRLGIIIDFKINQEFIAAVFCINKEDPIPTCNGKCHLVKQLEKAEEQENKRVPNSKREKIEILYINLYSSSSNTIDESIYSKRQTTGFCEDLKGNKILSDIFHPPKPLSI